MELHVTMNEIDSTSTRRSLGSVGSQAEPGNQGSVNSKLSRLPLIAGSVFGGLAVISGAFGAHWLEGAVPHWGLDAAEQARMIEVWEVAVRYQMYHALALLAAGLLSEKLSSPRVWAAASWLWIAGVVIFCGLLYALVLTGVKILGAIVPIGGLALIGGWALLAYAVCKGRIASFTAQPKAPSAGR